MAGITTKKAMKRLTDDEIDKVVIDQADEHSAWEKPVHVKRPKGSSLTIPSDLAARASFLARLHGSSGLDEWVTRVLRERVELEEGAFSKAQRDLSTMITPGKLRHRAVKGRR
jgi:hypothetical protein